MKCFVTSSKKIFAYLGIFGCADAIVFAGRIGEKRITYRLERLFLSAVLESSAKSAERLVGKMDVLVSDTNLLRIVEREPLPARSTPKILGVDDCGSARRTWKKRDRYGTVLVDLTNRKIIDLLIDREASTLEKWLKKNPGVFIISRDRYGKYIQGATNGAPDAMQPGGRCRS